MIPEKIYYKAKSVEDAIAMASDHADDFRYIAGGTDVIVNKFQGNVETNCLIDITGIEELKQVSTKGDLLHIGALIKLDDLKTHKSITENFGTLIEAAHSVATPILRKTATIGGNILCENRCLFYNQSEWWREAVGYCLKCDGDSCIATGGKKKCFSKFVSDTAPVLICYDAQIEVIDKNDLQIMKLEDIYTGDGINPRHLSKTALVKSVLLHVNDKYQCIFKKLRPRESVDYSSLTTSVSKNKNDRIKITLGGVDPMPVVIEGESLANRDALITMSLKKARIIDNEVYSRPYRRNMIEVFLNRSFDELSEKNTMNPFIKILFDEHEIIVNAIDLAKQSQNLISKDDVLYQKIIRQLIYFFRNYADRYHHFKEENILFPEMMKRNELLEEGVIKEMLENHEDFREMVRNIENKLDLNNFYEAQNELEKYGEALLDHIAVENEEVFQIVETIFDEDDLEKIGHRFIDCDRELGYAHKSEMKELCDSLRRQMILID